MPTVNFRRPIFNIQKVIYKYINSFKNYLEITFFYITVSFNKYIEYLELTLIELNFEFTIGDSTRFKIKFA